MQHLKRLLVCLERADHDARLIEWANLIADLAADTHTSFVHVRESGDVPATVTAAHPELLESPETLEAAIREDVDHHFRGKERASVRVIEQSSAIPLDLLRAARDDDADLVLVGRAPIEIHGQVVRTSSAERMARKAHCSVLVVPADRRAKVEKILVPFRDSVCSARALQQAVDLARAFGAEIICANVYHVHSGYARIGMTYEEFAAKLESHARQEFDHLVARVDAGDVNIRPIYRADPANDPASHFTEIANEERIDLIAIGARGRTGAAGILLGHVTETLIQTCAFPIMAVKKKGEIVGLLDALMTIAT